MSEPPEDHAAGAPTPEPALAQRPPSPGQTDDQPTELVEEKVVKKLDEDQNPDAYRELSITRRALTPNQWVQRLVVIVVLALITTAFAVLIFDLHNHPERDMTTYATLVITPLLAFAGPVIGFYFNDKHRRR